MNETISPINQEPLNHSQETKNTTDRIIAAEKNDKEPTPAELVGQLLEQLTNEKEAIVNHLANKNNKPRAVYLAVFPILYIKPVTELQNFLNGTFSTDEENKITPSIDTALKGLRVLTSFDLLKQRANGEYSPHTWSLVKAIADQEKKQFGSDEDVDSLTQKYFNNLPFADQYSHSEPSPTSEPSAQMIKEYHEKMHGSSTTSK